MIDKLQKACRERVEEAFQAAEAYYGVPLKRVPVTFNNRMKKTAGTAQYTSIGNKIIPREICLSNSILMLNGQDFIDDTPGHEAAHIIAMQLWGKGGLGHGYKWKEVMGVIGQRCFRYHTMETAPTTKSKNYVYRATCGSIITVKRGRHARIMQGVTYRLRDTGGQINRKGFIREEAA
jgi:SprT protein